MSELRLEAGKFYETRDGERAYVVAVDESRSRDYSAVGWSDEGFSQSWSIAGEYHRSFKNHPNDLVKLWRDEPKFKVGDRVRHIITGDLHSITYVEYSFSERCYTYCNGIDLWIMPEFNLELAPPEPAKADSDSERWEEACKSGLTGSAFFNTCAERDEALAEVAEQAKTIEGLHKERDTLATRVEELGDSNQRLAVVSLGLQAERDEWKAKAEYNDDCFNKAIAHRNELRDERDEQAEVIEGLRTAQADFGWSLRCARTEVDDQAKTLKNWGKRCTALTDDRDALAAKVARVEAVVAEYPGNTTAFAFLVRNALNPTAKPEPKRVKGWVNVARNGRVCETGVIWETHELAEKARQNYDGVIACIEIDVAEGEGL